MSVLLGDGVGGFASHIDFTAGSGAYAIVAADLNGDGKLDLATPNANTSQVSVLLGDGAGGFAPKTDYATGSVPDRSSPLPT